MQDRMPIMIGDDAVEKFIEFCKQYKYKRFLVVADENTAKVLGNKVHQAIQEQGWDVIYFVLDPKGLHANGVSILRVLNAYDATPRLFVAVGSGTITDIVRFSSHRSQNQFVSFPTAPSVDAYTSKNAPVTIGHLKRSLYTHAPIAIFTHLLTICEAPKFLTASGFGDLVSKTTSSTDWLYTHLIWGADFDDDIYQRAQNAGHSVIDCVDGILSSDPESMAVMMRGQFEGGFCMGDFKDSSPASGGEHHNSHMWEMMFHWDNKEGLFHGQAVGVAVIQSAEWYKLLRLLSKDEAKSLLDKVVIPSCENQVNALRKKLPLIAEELINGNPIYLQLTDPKKFTEIRERIIACWDEIQEAAFKVPEPDDVRKWIKNLGGPTTPEELGVSEEESHIAYEYGHYLRERFSISILRKLFGWMR